MEDVEDIRSIRSYNISSRRSNDEYDISSRSLNSDNPKPQISPTGNLKEILEQIDKQTSTRKRLPLPRDNVIPSFRIAGDNYPSARSEKPRSIREEKSNIQLNKEFEGKNPSLQRYLIREKFKILQQKNPNIEIPDFNDPKDMIEAYNAALRTNHFTSSSATWMIYMGIGYAVLQGILKWAGFKNIDNFATTQIEIMKHYPQLLKELGDPGGISAGSNWPPWLKLTVIMAIHTIVFLLMVKITGNDSVARQFSKVICGTGFMGGKSVPSAESEIAGDSAMSGLGGILGNLGGLLGGGGGGIMNMLGGLLGPSNTPNIDLDNLDNIQPVSERSVSDAISFSSSRKNKFDD